MSLYQWLVRPKPAPDATGKSLTGSDVAASALNGLIAFAVAWPTTEVTLRQLSLVVPEPYKELWSNLIATAALVVATGTQLYRMWKHDAPSPSPSPEKK